MTNLGQLVVYLKANLADFTRNMDRAKTMLRSFASRTSRIMSDLTAKFRRWARRIGLALVGAFTLGVKVLASFQDQMAKVSTMLTDQTMRYMPRYARAMRDMAVRFGQSTETLSNGLYDILSASVPADRAIMQLDTSVKAAIAGFTDAKTAAYGLAGVMNAYGQEVYKVTELADMMFVTQKRGMTTFGQFAPLIGRVTAIAASAGVRFEELAAAISTLTRAGLSTEDAITGLRLALVQLSGKEQGAVRTAAKYNIELSARALRTEGLIGLLQQLSRVQEEDQSKIFGRIQSRVILNTLIKNGTALLEDHAAVLDANGAMMEAYDKVTQSLGFRFKQVWQVIKNTLMSAVEPLGENLEQMTQWFVDNARAMRRWALRVGAHLNYVVDVFQEFIGLMYSKPKEGFNVLLQSLIAVMEAAGRVAIDLALRIGRGIWQGVKEGIFGKKGFASAEQEWRATGGGFYSLPSAPDVRIPTMPGTGMADAAALWEGIQKQYARVDIWANFGKDAREAVAQAFAGLPDLLPPETQQGLDRAAEHLRDALQGVGLQEFQELAMQADEWLVQMGKDMEGLKPPTDAERQALAEMGAEMQRVTELWEGTADAMADTWGSAFADMAEGSRNFGEVVVDTLKRIQRLFSELVFEQLVKPGLSDFFGNIISGVMGMGGLGQGASYRPYMERVGSYQELIQQGAVIGGSRGGLVYAQRGRFIPRGTDTVPAMLTPGEGVLDADLTDRLRSALAVEPIQAGGGGTINMIVTAIDAKSTYDFLYSNRRALASMMQQTHVGNHPYRRERR